MEGDLDEQRDITKELKEMGRSAHDPLIQLIRDAKERQFIRLEAARAIVILGKDGVEPLLTLLEEKDAVIRMAAIRSLGTIGDARAVPALLDHLYNSEQKIRLLLSGH